MAAIPLQFLTTNVSNTITFSAADAGLTDTVAFNSDTFITVLNDDAGAHQVTITVIDPACSCGGATATLSNIVESVPAGESRTFKLTKQYYDANNNGAQITYDDATSMFIAAYV